MKQSYSEGCSKYLGNRADLEVALKWKGIRKARN